MSNHINEKNIVKEIRLKQNLSPIWVDNINIGIRGDGVCFLRFMTTLPEGIVEQVQLMTSREHLKKFIDSICSSLNYMPTNNKKDASNRTSRCT